MPAAIRLLAIIEANTITGPAKNLLQFADLARCRVEGPAVEVHAAVFQRPGAPTIFLESAERHSLPVHVLPENRRFDSTVLTSLNGLVRDLNPDLVQSHAVKSHFLVRQAGIHRFKPWIAFHHGYTAPTLTARLYNLLDYWSLRAARHVITMSVPFQQEMIRKGVSANRITVVHNAIDPDWGASWHEPNRAAELRASMGIQPGAKVILLVGRFSREKDHHTILEAVARLRRDPQIPNPHLVLVGDGPERARIEQTIRSLQLDDAVTLTGQVPSAEPYYGIADAAVLSSRSEGSPNALLEAMAFGIPVVATNVGGIPEIVRHDESALLVSPGDGAGMAQALGQIFTDATLAEKLVAEARRVILARHTPQARTQRLIGIYRTILDGY